jgi:pimeloyl-ACP methyl ester carboxylesterase
MHLLCRDALGHNLVIGHNGPNRAFIFKDRPVLITVNNAPLYAYTAGKPLRPELPTVILIHGALHDHSVWGLQSRYLANHQYNVLAIDLPGHCKSGGNAPESVEEAAQSIIGLMDALDIKQAALVGHSLGSLIALEVAAQKPDRVSHLAMVGTAYPMRVSPALLDAAQNAQSKGIDMVNTFSLSMMAPPPSLMGPGTWLHGTNKALMHRVLGSNRQANVFYRSFKACDSYARGDEAMAQVQCPTLFLLGASDQMTPPQGAKSLIAHARHGKVVTLKAGHSLLQEAPDQALDALCDFLKTPVAA